MKSLKFAEKLNNRLSKDPVAEEVESLIDNLSSIRGFNAQSELTAHLTEGALLNVTKLASQALSLPHGEYMVWATDAGHTMLVPIPEAAKQQSNEVFEAFGKTYDIFTKDLLMNWGNVEKVLAEEFPPQQNNENNEDNLEDHEENLGDKDSEGSPFKSRIDMSTVDRTPIARAMQQHGHTVTSLAAACNVDPPAISRILRTPRKTQGDPGGRNPSLPLAARIANELKMDAEALFPDIFGTPKQDFKARQTPGNKGSGMKNHAAGSRKKGNASKTWTKGNSQQESIQRDTAFDSLVSQASKIAKEMI